MIAAVRKNPQDFDKALRACVAIVEWNVLVDDQDRVATSVSARGPPHVAAIVFVMSLQRVVPLLHKLRAIDTLKTLHAGFFIPAGAQALVMNHFRTRLVHDLKSVAAHLKTEIYVLVVAGRELSVEATDAPEQVAANQERRCGAIVDFAAEIVFG